MTSRVTLSAAGSAILLAAVLAGAHAQTPPPAPAATPPPAAAAPAPAAPAPAATTAPAPMAPTPPPPPPPTTAPPARPMMMPPPPPPAAPPKPGKKLVGPPGVAAVVNGAPIKTADVQQLAMQAAGQQVLDQLITSTIIDQEAKKANATPTAAQMAAKLVELRRQIAAQYPGQTLEAVLAQRGITMARVKTIMRTQIEVQNLISKNIQPVKMLHVRHILIMTKNPNNDPSAKPHTDAEARDIIAKIQADLKAGKSFEDEAKQYTEDPSGKANGGDLPIIDSTTMFDPNFLKAAMALKKGEVTPTPVESMYGLHLIYCVSTSDDPTPADRKAFADAADRYKQQQMGMQANAYVQSLKQKAKIVNYLAP